MGKPTIVTLLGLSALMAAWGPLRTRAQEPREGASPTAAVHPGAGEEGPRPAVDRLVEQLRRHPARPTTSAGQVGLFLIDATGGEATLIANEPDPWLNRCGSAAWSHDGRCILFDLTPGTKDYALSRLKAIHLAHGHPAMMDLGPGNCPSLSPSDDRIVFLLNPGGVPHAPSGVWLMNADGSERRVLGSYGRPKWSPDGRQMMIDSFADPNQVTIMDVRPEKSGVLRIPGHQVFTVPSWVSEGTIVAVIGSDVGDTIALIDVTDPEQGKVKEILWKPGNGLDVKPDTPVYSPATRRCVFVGRQEGKGMALFSFVHGQPDPPKRLEPARWDSLTRDPAFSPDGRYLVFASDRTDSRPGRLQSVEAPAISGITIDGDLKDWPVALERHALRNLQLFPRTNGTGGLQSAFLTTSPDLSAAFSVGYDAKEQVIYVAVIERDDRLIVGNTSSWDTDAVEIYVDGLHSDRFMPYPQGDDWVENLDASVCPALEYIGLPGKGPVFGTRKSAGVERSGEDNPILQFGDIHKTKTRMAFRRAGDVTTYEWAVQAFDHYPDKPTPLGPGMKIGFDVVVIDKDTPAKTPRAANDPEEDRAAWISWGPTIRYGEFKGFDGTKLGEIVLGRVSAP